MKIKKELYKHIRDSAFPDKSDDEIEYMFFKRPDNIRLTYLGFRMMEKLYESYSFSYHFDLLPKHFIFLSRTFYLPYYLNKGRLVVFSSQDATMITLCGDVKTFLERLT